MDKQPSTNQSPMPKRGVDLLKGILNAPSIQEQFHGALKEHSGTFVASVIDLYNSDNSLQQCEPRQVVMEALKAAVLKLPLNKGLGFAYLVPFKNKKGGFTPSFQIGYKGYIQLAMRTGQYRVLNADKAYEGEMHNVNKLTGEISFEGARKSDKIEGYFAHIEMINGFAKTLYMTKDSVLSHARRYSPSFGFASSAWQTNFDEMALKTVLRNLLSHYGFLSVEMMGAIENDHQQDDQQQRQSQTNTLSAIQHVNMEDVSFIEVEAPLSENSTSVNGQPSERGQNNQTTMNPGF